MSLSIQQPFLSKKPEGKKSACQTGIPGRRGYHTTKPDAQKVQQGKYFVVKKAKMRYNYSINADGKKDFIGKYVQKDVII